MASAEGRPRRSAAASNKAWATLMSKGGGEEDYAEEAVPEPKGGVKRSASKEQAATPGNTGRGRKKRTKLSESADTEELHPTPPQEQRASLQGVKPEVPKPSPRAAKKLPPNSKVANVPKVPLPMPSQNDDNLEMMHSDFDRHQANLAEKMDQGDEEEEELVPAERTTTKIPQKARGRPSTKPPPPAMTGMDDPNDADYVEGDEDKPIAKKRPTPRPRPIPPHISPVNRPPPVVMRQQIPRPATIVVRQQPPPTRVVYPNRFPTIVNGGPRVVQPRYVPHPQRNVNPAVLRQPPSVMSYETPVNVVRSIEKLTEDCKKMSSPEVVSAFELIELLRNELDRMQIYHKETNSYYTTMIEDVQAASQAQLESSQNRIHMLEQRVMALEGQLKKSSAIAHQKLLKTAVEGFRMNVSEHQPQEEMSPQKAQHQYVMMEGEASEQHMGPRDYLVQEEDYQQPGGFYGHDAVIQEASKELDNMM